MENKIFKFLIAYAFLGLLINCNSNEIEDSLNNQISQEKITSKSSALSKISGYSGEEYYRGIFLFEGEVADKVEHFKQLKDEISKMPIEARMGQVEFNNDIINGIKKINPTYFDDLKIAIESKNFNDIDNIMDVGASLAEAVIINSPKYQSVMLGINNVQQKIDITKYDLDTVDGLNLYLKDVGNLVTDNKMDLSSQELCIWVAAVIAVAVWDAAAVVNYGVVVNAAALALAYAAVYAKVKFWPKKMSLSVDKMSLTVKEQLIVEISNINP
ncbi:hypothetical protein ODZ84_05730 [Chryseobacterium fluminis]|uniref:hypothetical protein n=1 Tax=Chryseobacterium fluminis TaxID=2983606 RepID=UPI002255D37C|nr:hypothetical protein [Chryseobacterium sp. MMS21-Ot14]UZT99068.1 hypothetical protein ODZ84_05730 [Chryseobacterium sp. MMS21-Ot14]